MSPTVLALGLGSAVVHATWNLWVRQLGPLVRSAPLSWLLTTSSSVCCAPLVWVLLARVLGIALLSPLSYILILLALRHSRVESWHWRWPGSGT